MTPTRSKNLGQMGFVILAMIVHLSILNWTKRNYLDDGDYWTYRGSIDTAYYLHEYNSSADRIDWDEYVTNTYPYGIGLLKNARETVSEEELFELDSTFYVTTISYLKYDTIEFPNDKDRSWIDGKISDRLFIDVMDTFYLETLQDTLIASRSINESLYLVMEMNEEPERKFYFSILSQEDQDISVAGTLTGQDIQLIAPRCNTFTDEDYLHHPFIVRACWPKAIKDRTGDYIYFSEGEIDREKANTRWWIRLGYLSILGLLMLGFIFNFTVDLGR